MRVAVAVGFGLALSGCAAPVSVPEGFMHAFACPAPQTRTVIERAAGTPYATVWLGAEPNDPQMCVSGNGSGKTKRSRLFGRYEFNETLGGTDEEKAGARRALADLLSGRSRSAGFVLRGQSGEQVVEQWSLAGIETLSIDGRSVKTVKIRINYVYSANGRPSWVEVWWAPDYNLFVRSEASLEISRVYVWHVVKIRDPAEVAPPG